MSWGFPAPCIGTWAVIELLADCLSVPNSLLLSGRRSLFISRVCCIAGLLGFTSLHRGSQAPLSQAVQKATNILGGRYAYTGDLLRLDESIDEGRPLSWPTSPSPIKLTNWREYLRVHPDRRFASYIYSGLSAGFRIGFNRHCTDLRPSLRNHPSAFENSGHVWGFILAEREAGRLVGPLDHYLLPRVHTSPIGLVPKSQPNQWRMIVDLSYPTGQSVNDGIDSKLASISYASVDDAVQLILLLGRGTQLVKLDLENAYRNIPVHPQDQHLLAVSWQGDCFVDRALPFGLKSAPKIFSAVVDTVAWALHCSGIRYQIHYLDDFLLLGPPYTGEAAWALSTTLRVLDHLGLPVAMHKTVGPVCCLTFLGVVIDTESFELRLPSEKIQRLRALLLWWTSKKSCTRKELESLLGHLSHAATVVRPGRTFLRQLFSLLHLTKAPHHSIRLTVGARADLAWWKCFLQSWHGSSFFPLAEPSCHVYSDASGTYGCGAVSLTLGYVQLQWPEQWEEMDISVKELVPVVLAAALWGSFWQGQHIRFHSDNMAVVSILRTRTAKSPQLMHLLRCFAFYCAYYRFHTSCVHVPGAMNKAADALSRNNLRLFLSLAPQAQRCLIPYPLKELLITARPDWGSPAWTQLFLGSLTGVLPDPHQQHTM